MTYLTLEKLARGIPPAGMENRAVWTDKLEFALFCGYLYIFKTVVRNSFFQYAFFWPT